MKHSRAQHCTARRTVQHCTATSCSLLRRTAQYFAILRSTAKYGAVLHSAAQHCTACSSAVSHRTARSVNACCNVRCTVYRSNNFIVGLTNVTPVVSRPTLWNYTVCGQYPGAVPGGATVSLYCHDILPPFRYLIVQFPLTNEWMNFCELQVFARGMPRYLHCMQACTL